MTEPKHVKLSLVLLEQMFCNGNEWPKSKVESSIEPEDMITGTRLDGPDLSLYFNHATADTPISEITATKL